jgi:hypothetical protein
MVRERLVDPSRLVGLFEEIEPELYRYPAIAPVRFAALSSHSFRTRSDVQRFVGLFSSPTRSRQFSGEVHRLKRLLRIEDSPSASRPTFEALSPYASPSTQMNVKRGPSGRGCRLDLRAFDPLRSANSHPQNPRELHSTRVTMQRRARR